MPTPKELAQLIFVARNEKVMFDVDLAKLYDVSTKALNQAVSRNKTRFPKTSLSASPVTSLIR